jgi:hypothetical protein
MSMRAARVTQADISRAIRAADQAGSKRIVEITPDGTIRIVPADLSPKVTGAPWRSSLAPEKDFRL